MKKDESKENLKGLLDDFVKSGKISQGLAETQIKRLWQETMPHAITKYTSTVFMKKNVLFIKLNSAPLRQEMSYRKNMIRKRLNKELGRDFISEVVVI